jgi:tetratricopeptide (TPR) repeat protein
MNILSCIFHRLTLSALLLFTTLLHAQTVDPAVEYNRIRNLAFSGLLAEAEESALILVDSFPTYNDAKVLLARIYAWQKKYEPALVLLDSIMKEQPENNDATEAKGDILSWMAGDKAAADAALLRRMAEEAEAYRSDSIALVAHNKAISDSLMAARKIEIFAGYYFDAFHEPYRRFWQVTGREAVTSPVMERCSVRLIWGT